MCFRPSVIMTLLAAAVFALPQAQSEAFAQTFDGVLPMFGKSWMLKGPDPELDARLMTIGSFNPGQPIRGFWLKLKKDSDQLEKATVGVGFDYRLKNEQGWWPKKGDGTSWAPCNDVEELFAVDGKKGTIPFLAAQGIQLRVANNGYPNKNPTKYSVSYSGVFGKPSDRARLANMDDSFVTVAGRDGQAVELAGRELIGLMVVVAHEMHPIHDAILAGQQRPMASQQQGVHPKPMIGPGKRPFLTMLLEGNEQAEIHVRTTANPAQGARIEPDKETVRELLLGGYLGRTQTHDVCNISVEPFGAGEPIRWFCEVDKPYVVTDVRVIEKECKGRVSWSTHNNAADSETFSESAFVSFQASMADFMKAEGLGNVKDAAEALRHKENQLRYMLSRLRVKNSRVEIRGKVSPPNPFKTGSSVARLKAEVDTARNITMDDLKAIQEILKLELLALRPKQ